MESTHTATPAALGAEQITDDGRQWIEVMPTVEKARNGRQVYTITRDDLETLAASIIEKGDTSPVDFDHGGATGGSTVAAGWFTGQAEVRDGDDGSRLWAEVQWNPDGLEAITSRKFRFISPEWRFSDHDPKSGLLTKAKDFIAATLTNRPFFKELSAVAAESVWGPDEGFEQMRNDVHRAVNGSGEARFWVMDVTADKALVSEYSNDTVWVVAYTRDGDKITIPERDEWQKAEKQWVAAARKALAAHTATRPFVADKEDQMDDLKAIAAGLGLAEDATEDEIIAAATAAKAAADAAAAKPKKTPTRKDATMANLADIAAALGLDPDADEATVLAAISQTKETADKVDSSEEELDKLRGIAAKSASQDKRIEVIEAERRNEKIKFMLAEGVRTGKVIPAEKAVLAKQFASNVEGLQELLDARADGVFNLNARGNAGIEDEPEEVRSVIADFSSDHADDVETEGARLHAKAIQSLRSQGKTVHTEAEYLEALTLVSA